MFDRAGFIYGDYALAFFSTVCALFVYYEVAERCRIGHHMIADFLRTKDAVVLWQMMSWRQTGLWMVGIGWTIFSMRMWYLLIVDGDLPITPITVVAFLLIAAGTVVLQTVKSR